MCFNVVIVNPRKKDVRVPVFNLLDYMNVNRDGFSIYTVKDGKEMVYRTLDSKKFIEFIKTNVSYNELTHMHFRLASSGSIMLKNVHMWRIEDESYDGKYYYVSHNGMVSKYANYTHLYPNHAYWRKKIEREINENTESDTLAFIRSEDFYNAIFYDITQLENVLKNNGFYGAMFLTNKDEVIAISYRKPIYITLSSSLLFFSNTDIKEYVSKTKKIYGISFKMALETVVENAAIIYNVKNMKVRRTVKFTPPRYIYNEYLYYIDE